MIDLSKVIYCIGSTFTKRANFRKSVSETVVFADNDEVVAALNEQGKTFFVFGDFPFKNMTVYEFIRYNRMIISGEIPDKKKIKGFFKSVLGKSLSLGRKIGSLDVFEYRAVVIASKLTEKTERVLVNFDGLIFSKDRGKRLFVMLRGLSKRYSVCVAVSDNRFINHGSVVRRYGIGGEVTELSLRADSREMRGKALIKAYALRRRLKIKSSDVRKIVVAV